MGSLAKACTGCHSRKIRCDASSVGIPCSRCRADGFLCAPRDRKKRQRSSQITGTATRSVTVSTASRLEKRVPKNVMSHMFPHFTYFQDLTQARAPASAEAPGENGLLLPIPGQLESMPPGEHGLPKEDEQFLKSKGCFNFPSIHLTDQFISAYFRIHHPFFPVIDKPAFLARYRRDPAAEICSRGSIILLQALIFSASSFVSTDVLHACGYLSRKQARNITHSRVKYLYNLGYESDDLINIQALLLLSQFFPSMVEQKHTWLWVHQAISLAQGAGLHRRGDVSDPRNVRAKVWWCCVVRDRMIALGTNRPVHINSLDCDVPPLSAADLAEDEDTDQDRQIKASFAELGKLCQVIEGVLSLPLINSERLQEQITLCDQALQTWSRESQAVTIDTTASVPESTPAALPAMYSIATRLVYNLVSIVLRQSGHILDRDSGARDPSPEVASLAEVSAELVAKLLALDVARLAPIICITAVIPPVVIFLRMIKVRGNHCLTPAVEKVKTCLELFKQMGEVQWHAKFYHDFFQLALSANLAVSQARMRATNDDQGPGSAESLGATRRTHLTSPGTLQEIETQLGDTSLLPDWSLANEKYRHSSSPFWSTMTTSDVIDWGGHDWIDWDTIKLWLESQT